MALRLQIDQASLLREADKQARLVLRGALTGVQIQTRGLEQDLEKITQVAAPGKLYKGWQSRSLNKIAKEPAGWVYFSGGSRSQGAITAWTQPGRLKAQNGGWLAVPLPAAGPRGRKNDLSPAKWETAHGVKLRYVPRRGLPALLVLDQGRLTPKTQRGTVDRRAVKAGRESRVTIPIFILIPHQDFANGYSVDPVIERRRSGFAGVIEDEIKAALTAG